MKRSSIPLILSLGTILAAGCGDDAAGETSSASESGTDGTSSTTSPTTPTTEPTTADVDTTGGNSDSEGNTTTNATTETTVADSSTGEPDTSSTGPVDPSTTTTGDPPDTSSTGEPDTSSTGDTTTDDTTTANAEECPLAEAHAPCDMASDDALHALGLNCTTLGGDWVDNENAVKLSNLVFEAPPPLDGKRTWQVAKSYGTYIDPMTNKPFWNAREGDKLLLISSGLLPPPNAQGVVIVDDGDVYNDTTLVFDDPKWDSDSMPPPMSPEHGSPDPMGYTNCDGANDCSNTIKDQWELGGGDANDKMWFNFELTAPAIANGQTSDAKGYTFNFAYFSAEFPEWVGDTYNDIFVVWQSSEDYTGNVTFINGQPMTVTALWPIDFPDSDPHLQGTGHIDDGGATGWYTAQGGVKPGETFTLGFAIFDMGDSTYDTTAIIDNWQWDCEGCVPNEVDDCEIIPM